MLENYTQQLELFKNIKIKGERNGRQKLIILTLLQMQTSKSKMSSNFLPLRIEFLRNEIIITVNI